MAIYNVPTRLGDYANTASNYADLAAPSSWSSDVGYTSNAYVNPLTQKAYTPQDIIQQGGGNPDSIINVPHGADFLANYGPYMMLAPAAGMIAGAAAGAGGAGAAAGGTGAGAFDATAAGLDAGGLAGVGTGGATGLASGMSGAVADGLGAMGAGGAGAAGGGGGFLNWLSGSLGGGSTGGGAASGGGLFGNGGLLGTGLFNGSGVLGSGISGTDLLKSGLNYFMNNRSQDQMNSRANQILNAGNALNQPQRAPYQAASLNMVQDPSQYLNTDPFATAMRDFYKNSVIPSQVAKSGNPSQVIDQSGSQFNTSVAQDYNQKLQTLAGYGGFNQMANSFTGNPAAELFGAGANYSNNSVASSLPILMNGLMNGNNHATSNVPGGGAVNPVKTNPISNSTLNFSQ